MKELPAQADVVVIGGGIMGLAIAYEIAGLQRRRIVVLEKSYLCGGASGRNGGGVRAQWSSEDNIRLMKRSIAICRAFASEMGINVWFRQGGYLFLARDEARAKQLEAAVELQRAAGLKTQLIDAMAAKRLVPELDPPAIVAASYNPDDGVVFPWPFVWGYARGCERRGVEIHTFTPVTGFETAGSRVTGVSTPRGTVRSPLVINAAGAWSPMVSRQLGVELPNRPYRHEICSTEPLKPFLQPLVADLATGLYLSQSMRGEIVGGVSDAQVTPGLDQESSMRFLGLYARAATQIMPILGGLRVLRQWAGCYDVTPDHAPIIGRVDGMDGFILACGFMGHGFMMAPVMAQVLADHLFGADRDSDLFERWNLRRFAHGGSTQERMVLG